MVKRYALIRSYIYIIGGIAYGFIRTIECDENNNALIINGLRIKLEPKSNYIDFGQAKFKRLHYSLIETFVMQSYALASVENRVVIDIGAFIGDTAIYFALRGAKLVYAIEPHPGAFSEMLWNIKLNHMENRIIPINMAIASKKGSIKISSKVDIDKTSGTYYGPESNSDGDIEIPTTTLQQLIEYYNVEPEVLKMDCEGCEYDIILNDYNTIKQHFEELIFEYHKINEYKLKDLLNKLNNDYKCNITKIGSIGIAHCIRL